jgi:hypothetical protein
MRTRACIVYGLLDLLMAALYLLLFLKLVPSRSPSFTAVAVGISGLLAAGGIGMFVRAPWGKKVAAAASVTMLIACLALITLLAFSAAYLHGIYDGIGQAGSAFALLAAFLAFEVVGLLPALQLAHLRRLRRLEPRS